MNKGCFEGRVTGHLRSDPIRVAAGTADVIRLGGPAQWDCSDVKFSLAYLSVDELESPMRERIEAIPTRLTLDFGQMDATIEGAREGTLALRRVRTYVLDRVASGAR